MQRHTSHFKMVARRKFSDQNKSFGVNYLDKINQIWAADVDTSQRKILFCD